VQPGEDFTLYLTIKNVGRGRSFHTLANLKNLSGAGVLLRDARFTIDNVMPGEERRVAFTFRVNETFSERELKLELNIEEHDLRDVTVQRIRVPIEREALPVTAQSGVFTAAREIELREQPLPAGRVVLRAPAGVAMPILGASGDFVRVDVGAGRPAWVLRTDGGARVPGATAPGARLSYVLHNSPPLIESDALQNLSVRGATVTLRGTSTDENRVLDMYIFVGPNKVFYRSNRDGSDPRRFGWEAPLPLRPGANLVTVVAREDDDVTARRVYVIRRDGPNGELLATPRRGEGDGDDDE
jgi:carboxyl-terminal processing protease